MSWRDCATHASVRTFKVHGCYAVGRRALAWNGDLRGTRYACGLSDERACLHAIAGTVGGGGRGEGSAVTSSHLSSASRVSSHYERRRQRTRVELEHACTCVRACACVLCERFRSRCDARWKSALQPCERPLLFAERLCSFFPPFCPVTLETASAWEGHAASVLTSKNFPIGEGEEAEQSRKSTVEESPSQSRR